MSDHLIHYDELEQQFAGVLSALRPGFSREEMREVESYLSAREYGLALETIVGILIDAEKSLPYPLLRSISSLALLMEMDMDFLHPYLAVIYERHRPSLY